MKRKNKGPIMTKEHELHDLLTPGFEIRPGIYHHPRSPLASPERLQELLGSIKLTGPVPSGKFLDEDEDDDIDWIDSGDGEQ
jgi:hypothetical protein